MTKPRWCLDKFPVSDPQYENCGFNKNWNGFISLDKEESEVEAVGHPSS